MDVIDLVSKDDDEEFAWFVHRDPYIVQPRIDLMEKWSDPKFRVRFRINKSTVMFLVALLEPKIRSQTDRNHAVDPVMKILMTLRFYGGGLKLVDAGDLVGIHKSTACNIIRDVSHELASLASQFIKMPEEQDILNARQRYYDRARFPRTIGSLDCTHIRIQAPNGDMAEVYRCRKGYFSINVQTIASVDLKILDIVARFPGSVHDMTVWNNSDVKEKLERGVYGDSIIVADGGYRNTRFVATPL